MLVRRGGGFEDSVHVLDVLVREVMVKRGDGVQG